MEKLFLPGFFRIRNPQAGANPNEPEFIMFSVISYTDTTESCYEIRLKCTPDVYALYKFIHVEYDTYLTPTALGMEIYIRMELAKAISKFAKMDVVIPGITDGVAGDPYTIRIVARIQQAINISQYCLSYGDNMNLFPYGYKSSDSTAIYDKHRDLLMNTIYNTKFFKSKNVYSFTTIMNKRTSLPLYHDLTICYDDMSKITLEEMAKNTPPTYVEKLPSVDMCLNQLISEILNQFIIRCDCKDLSVGFYSVSRRAIASCNIVVYANTTDIKLAFYPSFNYIVDGKDIDLSYNLTMDKRRSKYILELDTNDALCDATIKCAYEMVNIYKSRNKMLESAPEYFNIKDMMECDPTILANENELDGGQIVDSILQSEALIESSQYTQFFDMLNECEECADSTINIDDIYDELSTNPDDPYNKAAMIIGGMLGGAIVNDISNVILQHLCQFGYVFMNALNVTTKTKNKSTSKILTSEVDGIGDIDIESPETHDGRSSFTKTGEYVIPHKSTNRRFNRVMGKLVEEIKTPTVNGCIYVYTNGNMFIADTACGPSDTFHQAMTSEYEINLMRRAITEMPYTSFDSVDRPFISCLHSDAYFSMNSLSFIRKCAPIRFAVLGQYNTPKHNSIFRSKK